MSSNPLLIEESAAGFVRSIAEDDDWVVLNNDTSVPIDEQTLISWLQQIKRLERVRMLTVGWNSAVTNLRFLQLFPALDSLMLRGRHLRSLEGLHYFHGKRIDIDTETNRTRTIAQIADTAVTDLKLRWARHDDLSAIGRCQTLRSLLLASCPCLRLDHWQCLPLEFLQLYGGTIDELADSASLKTLRVLTCHGCRKLERFLGDHSALTQLVLTSCSHLNFETLAAFSNLKFLDIVSIRKILPFSVFTRLPRLTRLSLRDCAVKFDVMALKETAPSLEKLLIQGAKKEILIELSLANPDVFVQNDRLAFKNGSPVMIG